MYAMGYNRGADTADLARTYDVVVIGGGNAALCAAISARQSGVSVLLLEHAPRHSRGGNSRHTRNLRAAHEGPCGTLTGSYPESEFWDDLLRVTRGRTDEQLARVVIHGSRDALPFMEACGVKFQPALRGTIGLSRTNAFFLGGGKALVNTYYGLAAKLGVDIVYDCEVTALRLEDGQIRDLTVARPIGVQTVNARSVVAASGGFQANLEWLKQAWGTAAENFIIRGTPYARGTVLKSLMDQGVATVGDPTQGHAVAIDARSPKFDGGIVTRLDCVPFGVVLNRDGERFYDEGEDVWPKRYAIWGRLIAQQPGQIAYSIIDSQARELFIPSVFPAVEGNTLHELAVKLGLEPAATGRTIAAFNAAVLPGVFQSGSIEDTCCTQGVTPPKTHWARRIEQPPFYGYPLRPGITFTYLGLKVTAAARVLMADGRPVKNLWAAGEIMAGNILGQGYTAGVGMTIGTVFGRISGTEAARHACR
jgi:tricarballylate dehydrogenase